MERVKIQRNKRDLPDSLELAKTWMMAKVKIIILMIFLKYVKEMYVTSMYNVIPRMTNEESI